MGKVLSNALPEVEKRIKKLGGIMTDIIKVL